MILGKYPKEYRKNLEWRRELLLKAKKDRGFREKVKELFFRDPIFAFNAFFYTLDVRRRPWHHRPFCTFEDYQDSALLELVESIDKGEDILIEKSRDMGASWMVILVYLWFWLKPEGGSDFLLGSRIEDYVDKKGDMRTLMEKARYAFYRLPRWLWPKGFNPKKHDNFMKLQNPHSGSSITGESNNANFSTGGRYLSVLFDEFAKWESTDASAWTAAGDATPSRCAVSTAFGAAGQYYDLVTDGKTRKIRLHWSKHPRKAEGAYCLWPKPEALKEEENEERFIRSPWYDRECARRRPIEIAQELDMDYVGAGNPVFDGKAGRRVGELLRRGRVAVDWYEPLLDTAGLKRRDEPREYEGIVVLWEVPSQERTYVLGVDVVEGVSDTGDFAVVKVVDRESKSVVGSYFSMLDEVLLAKVVKGMSDHWTTSEMPWVGIETIGPGLSTFDLCVESHGMTNLFMMPKFDQSKQSVSFRKGWRTDSTSRNKLISLIREWLQAGEGWGDQRLVREMTTFVRNKNGKGEAKAGTNDDEVLAFGIALGVDLLAPKEEVKREVKRREDGLPDNLFNLASLRIEGGGETIEERCLATVMAKVGERKVQEDEFYENSLDLMAMG